MSKSGVFMQQHLAAVQQQSLDNVTTFLGDSWTSTQVHPLPPDITIKQGQNHQKDTLLHSGLWTVWLRYSSLYFTISLAVCKDPLQCKKCKIFPTMQWKKTCREGQECMQKAQVGEYMAAQLTLQQQTASRDERGSVIRGGFPSLPTQTPEAARKTLWWVEMGENQEASPCEVCWVTLAGFARRMLPTTYPQLQGPALPWGLSTFFVSDFWKIYFLLILQNMLTFLLHARKYFILHQMECLGMFFLTPDRFFFHLARKHQYSCYRLAQDCLSQQQIQPLLLKFCWSILCGHLHQCYNYHCCQFFGKEHKNQHTSSGAVSSLPLLCWTTLWARGLQSCF